jgi:hypothetical protein
MSDTTTTAIPRPAGEAAVVGSVWRRVVATPAAKVRWAALAALAVPFVLAAVVLRSRHWNPVLDLAMTELRVRDVFTRHSPLIGLPGRIGVFPDQGSHPGPLSFYLLSPVYRLVGSDAWGLLVAMIVLNLLAIGLALWIAQRRGGAPLVLAVAALLVVIVRGYAMVVVTQPWNPYLPLLFWVVVLLGVWSVLLGDHAMVVVVAAAGSLCAQTHMPYLGLCLGMGGVCILGFVHTWFRQPLARGRLRRAGLWAVAVVAVTWSPVILDQVRHTPGNLSMLNSYFRNPPEPPVGMIEGVRLLLRHLDIIRIVRGAAGGDGFLVASGFRLDGTILPGVAFLVMWAVAAVVAARMRHRMLVALHIVLAAALALATISMGRIFGKVWYYLTLWMWSVTLVMVAAVCWTLCAWMQAHRARRGDIVGEQSASRFDRWSLPAGFGGALAVIGIISYIPLVFDAATVEVPEQYLSDSLRALVGPTADALDAGLGAADGRTGTYLITWNDALYFGSQGYGLVNELERRGFHVGVPNTWRVPVTRQRVIAAQDATAEVRVVTGSYVETLAAEHPEAEMVAFVEPRDAAELAEYDQLDAELRQGLHDIGLDDLIPTIGSNLFGVQLDSRVPPPLQQIVDKMLVLGQPEAVFILPIEP